VANRFVHGPRTRTARAVVLLHRRDARRVVRFDPVKPTATSLSWATSARQLFIGALDSLDPGQELVNQLRAHHRASSQAALSGCNVPRDGVMSDPGELARITQRPGQIKRI
jgi:hypothetical protein